MNKTYYNFIDDKEVMRTFYDVVFDNEYSLNDGEFLFIAASARNKELSEGERKDLGISNNEMYHTECCYTQGFDAFYSRVCRFEANIMGFLSGHGKPFPYKTLALYVAINPISIKKAFLYRMKQVTDTVEIITNSKDLSNNVSVTNNMLRCLKMPNAVATKAVSKKHWLDIDIDFIASYKPELEHYNRSYSANIRFRLRSAMEMLVLPKDFKIAVVYTKGGIHLLFPTKVFSKDLNPSTILPALQARFGEISKEIEVTSGGCPIPGCYQRGRMVKFETVNFS
jgi:hypothetical protein